MFSVTTVILRVQNLGSQGMCEPCMLCSHVSLHGDSGDLTGTTEDLCPTASGTALSAGTGTVLSNAPLPAGVRVGRIPLLQFPLEVTTI